MQLLFHPPVSQRGHRGADDGNVVDDVAPVRESNDRQMLSPRSRVPCTALITIVIAFAALTYLISRNLARILSAAAWTAAVVSIKRLV